MLKFLIFTLCIALVRCHTKADFRFHCDTPDEWLKSRSRSIYPGQLWPNGTVTYELHSSLTSQDTIEIFKAFHDIQNKTCIRFTPRSENESSYVSIEHDDNTCGVAHVCRTGGYQFARFGGGCVFANVMVHELGHTLCLGHEQTRKDRDDFVHFDPCKEGEVPGRDDFETRGHFYDYTSQMHYQCGWCPGGWPKMEGVSKCGMDVQEGLSVLDADKINDFYDCQGCMSHRWRRTETLTVEDKESMIPFGQTNEGEPLYLCRTYVGGEMVPGKYSLNSTTCFVAFNGTEHSVRDKVQVFTIPNRNSRGMYRPLPIDSSSSKDDLVPVGRTPNGVSQYAAVVIVRTNASREVAIGKVYGNDLSKAYVSHQGRELEFYDFEVIGCS